MDNSSVQIKKLSNDIKNINLNIDKKKLNVYLSELDKFVALENEKMEIISNIKSVIYQKKHDLIGKGDNTPLIGLFLGEPGSGKTELAKVWGKLLITILNEKEEEEKVIRAKTKYDSTYHFILALLPLFILFLPLICFFFMIISIPSYIKNRNGSLFFWGILTIIFAFILLIFSDNINFNIHKIADFKYIKKYFDKDVEIKRTSYNSEYIIASKDDLVAGYVGQTSIKTRGFLEKHKDKAILIDEVYNLLNSTEHNSFGQECITAIMEFIDRNPYSVVGLLGYEKNTKEGVLKSQPGLIRRCGMKVIFKPYTSDDLYNIFIRKIENEKLNIKEMNLDKVKRYFKDNYNYFIHYGGDIKLLVSYIKDKIANEHFNDEKQCYDINMVYFKEALGKVIKSNSSFIKIREKSNQIYDNIYEYINGKKETKNEDLINLN